METLSPASTYQFTVVAENLIGNSSVSEPLSFATIGLAPDMPPFNLSLLEVGLRSVVISVEVSWCAVWLCVCRVCVCVCVCMCVCRVCVCVCVYVCVPCVRVCVCVC